MKELNNIKNRISDVPTHSRIICGPGGCNKAYYLTERENRRQMDNQNEPWRCPVCGQIAKWDRDNFESYYNEMENEK